MRNPVLATVLAAGLLVGVAGVAWAADPAGAQAGPYVSLGVGANWLNDADTTGAGATRKMEYDTGMAGIGALGYRFDKNWRGELEVGYRRNDVDSVASGGGAGDAHAWDYMANVLYDVDTGTKWTPYLGLGAGAVNYHGAGLQLTPSTTVNDDDTVFAYQGILGVAYEFTPSTQLLLDYHYLRANNPSVDNSAGNSFDTKYRSNTVLLGVRYTLNTGAM